MRSWSVAALAGAGVWLLSLSLLSGCATLRRSPVAENVVLSRQLSHRGIDAMQQGKWDEAEMLFSEAIEVCPADERAHHRFAEVLWRRGAWMDAIRHMEKAVSLSGGDDALLVELSEMYLARGETGLAAERAEAAVRRQRNSAAAWRLRGDVLRRRGEFDEAMLSYHRALSIEPSLPAAQLALGEMYLQQQRPRRALSTLESLARNYPPDNVPQQVLLMQGVALKQLARYDDAVAVLAEAARRPAVTADVLVELAEAQWLAGDAASARLAARGAVTRAPSDQRAQALLAHLEAQIR